MALSPQPFVHFEEAVQSILSFLHSNLGFSTWMLTRFADNEQVILQIQSDDYEIPKGTSFPWEDTLCSRMITAQGPQFAPRILDVPAYRCSDIARQAEVSAYLGVPIMYDDGQLFGTLCAVDRRPQDPQLYQQMPLVELMAKILGTLLVHEMKSLELARQLERSQTVAMTDALTGLLNRHGWEEAIAREEARSRRYGSPLCLMMIDLDQFKKINDAYGHAQGDALLKKTATCLRNTVRENDIVARIGGDEFAILALECDNNRSKILEANISHALAAQAIKASLGIATRNSQSDINATLHQADIAMYQNKKRRKFNLM